MPHTCPTSFISLSKPLNQSSPSLSSLGLSDQNPVVSYKILGCSLLNLLDSHFSQNCGICGKVFSNVYRLQRHMISHEESAVLRRFKCSDCGKAFKFKHHLKVNSFRFRRIINNKLRICRSIFVSTPEISRLNVIIVTRDSVTPEATLLT